jgi:CheY-like chemotaxis protein
VSALTASALPVVIRILIADDDEEDRMLARDALVEARLANDLHFVSDGEELMQYLRAEGKYSAPGAAPRPGLLLLDINMPKMDGFECLRQIRADPALRQIPIVILTTSRAEADVYRSYDLGVNSFVSKPVTFDQLVEAMRTLGRYWFQIVALPPEGAE